MANIVEYILKLKASTKPIDDFGKNGRIGDQGTKDITYL